MRDNKNILPIQSKVLSIFRMIWEKGPLSRGELQHLTGLKLTTLVRGLEELERNGFIIKSGQGESTGGRRPVLYKINERKAALIGVDISRIYIKVALMDMKSNIIKSKRVPFDEKLSPDIAVGLIREIIKSFEISIPVLGIGIGSVGPLDKDKGIILNPEHFPASGWKNVSIREMLEKETGYPAFLENGANCAVLAEFYYGAARDCRSAGYIHVGIGIRSGVLNHGRLVRTVDNRDDVLGHMIIDIDGKGCYCGRYGCLGTYCTFKGMLQEFKAELKRGRISNLLESYKSSIDELPLSLFCKAVKEEDPLAIQIMVDGAAALGTGIANFANLLDLDLVIINGPVIQLSELYYKQCINTAAWKTVRNIRYSKGELGDNAIVIGAGLIVLGNFLQFRTLCNVQ